MIASLATSLLLTGAAGFTPLPHAARPRAAPAARVAARASAAHAQQAVEVTAAFALLEARVATSRVGPIATGVAGFFRKAAQSGGALWVQPLLAALWQPLDMATVALVRLHVGHTEAVCVAESSRPTTT